MPALMNLLSLQAHVPDSCRLLLLHCPCRLLLFHCHEHSRAALCPRCEQVGGRPLSAVTPEKYVVTSSGGATMADDEENAQLLREAGDLSPDMTMKGIVEVSARCSSLSPLLRLTVTLKAFFVGWLNLVLAKTLLFSKNTSSLESSNICSCSHGGRILVSEIPQMSFARQPSRQPRPSLSTALRRGRSFPRRRGRS